MLSLTRNWVSNMIKRNIGKEIIQGLEEFKACRRGSGNVFQDIGFAPVEAENLKLRSSLMMRIEDYYQKSGATKAAAAKALGLTTPR